MQHYVEQWRIQGRQFGAISPPNGCGAPLKWLPSDKNAPLLVPIEVKTKTKNTQSKLNNALHFVELRYFRDGL